MKKGFTLIELLVVIAIIAILAAILFPVFAQAREKARAITCVSNEKQMGLAILQYVQDNDEQFPFLQYYYYGSGTTPLYAIDWTDAIYPYVKNGNLSSGVSNVVIHNGTGGVWSCPSFPVAGANEYGINWELARDGGGTYEAQHDTAYSVETVNDASITSPADTLMVGEHGNAADVAPVPTSGSYNTAYIDPTETNWTPTGSIKPVNGQQTGTDGHLEIQYDLDCATTDTTAVCGTGWGTSAGDMPRSRHTNTSNALFVDGHVKAIHKGSWSWWNTLYVQGVYESFAGQVYGTTTFSY
jgi:prepilin-type N-terminal cleavage/methylation domain-containing protein/prepilin-type processing-associated H-X9-DG protein